MNKVEATNLLADVTVLGVELVHLRAEREALKLQAQIHAQEARTANATIAEIYQLCSGGKGEPGNWHGAEPVRAVIAERDAYAATLRQQAERCPYCDNTGDVHSIDGEWRGACHECKARQPELSFDSPEALAVWLESLQGTNDDGAVIGGKWKPAQVAARAIRGMVQQADRSGAADEAVVRKIVEKYIGKTNAVVELITYDLRAALFIDWRFTMDAEFAQMMRTAPAEQAGRVDARVIAAAKACADRLQHLCDTRLRGKECAEVRECYQEMRAAMQAALAQNTQGEVRIVCDWKGADPFPRFIEAETPKGKSISLPWHDRADGLKEFHLYLHAERARVPEFTPADAALLREAVSRLPKSRLDAGHNLAFRFDAAFTAALSQPEDADHE